MWRRVYRLVKMELCLAALLLCMLANTISGTTQCSNRFRDDERNHVDHDQDDCDQDSPDQDNRDQDDRDHIQVRRGHRRMVRGEEKGQLDWSCSEMC